MGIYKMEKNIEQCTPGCNHSLSIGSLLTVYLFTRMKTSSGKEGKGKVKGEVREPNKKEKGDCTKRN